MSRKQNVQRFARPLSGRNRNALRNGTPPRTDGLLQPADPLGQAAVSDISEDDLEDLLAALLETEPGKTGPGAAKDGTNTSTLPLRDMAGQPDALDDLLGSGPDAPGPDTTEPDDLFAEIEDDLTDILLGSADMQPSAQDFGQEEDAVSGGHAAFSGQPAPDDAETRALLEELLSSPVPPAGPYAASGPETRPEELDTKELGVDESGTELEPSLPPFMPEANGVSPAGPDPSISDPVISDSALPAFVPHNSDHPDSDHAVPAPPQARQRAHRRQDATEMREDSGIDALFAAPDFLPAAPARQRSAGMDDLDRVLQVGTARPSAAAKWRTRAIWAVILGGLIWVAFLPYAFQVGGEFVVQPLDRAEARARTDGEITELFVSEGDWVEKDQILAILSNWDEERDVILNQTDGDRLRADLATMLEGARPEQIAVAEEALRTAQVQVAITERDRARQEALFASGTIAQKLRDDARDARELAQANLAQAQASLDLVQSEARQTEIDAQLAAIARNDEELSFARLMLEYANVRSPVAGQIVGDLTSVPVGAFLSTGALFAEIEDNRTIIAEIELPETMIEEVKIGAEAELRLWSAPDNSIFGTVRSISPRAEQRDFGWVIRVQVEVPNPDGSLAANMTGFGKISAGDRPVWEVFSRAVLRFFTIELWSWVP